MSKTLNALMRLKRMEIDEMRMELNRLLDALQRTIETIEELNRHRLNEKLAMQENLGNVNYVASYYAYIAYTEKEGLRLHDIKTRQEYAISQLQDKMRELFGDYKKYDIIKENQIQTQKTEEQRLDKIFLDDLAGQRATNLR